MKSIITVLLIAILAGCQEPQIPARVSTTERSSPAATNPNDTLPIALWCCLSVEQHPEEWSSDNFVMKNRIVNIEVWIANGEEYVDMWRPEQIKSPNEYRKRFWHAYLDLGRHKTLKDMR